MDDPFEWWHTCADVLQDALYLCSLGDIRFGNMEMYTLRLDLVRLRASGVGASIDEVSHATQEARALSRDIAVALEAARDLRAI